MANILIVDDDQLMGETLAAAVKRIGHSVANAFTLKEGLQEAFERNYDVIFLDVRMPDGSGLDALTKIRQLPSAPEVIIITGFGDPDGAEIAIRSGAWDYLEKPSSLKEMTLPLVRALQYREEKKARQQMATTARGVIALKREGIIGSSPQIKKCLDLVVQAVTTNTSVLITGETGSGKELFAQAIHDNSFRADKSFVIVDCSALPATLVESLLFGYEKGAFTGAHMTQDGLIKQADGGTLFLDEIGELPVVTQKAFLRVLQEKRYRPLGGKREISSDFRLIAATNRDLDQMEREGRFRSDLLFRIRSFVIHLPPLRERVQDIKEIVLSYMNKLCEHYGLATKGFSPEFFDSLARYEWPGNVRELLNTLEGIFTATRHDPTLFPKHLPTHIRVKVARSLASKENALQSTDVLNSNEGFPSFKDFRKKVLMDMEHRYLMDLMTSCNGTIEEACRISRLSRSRLYGLLKEHGIGNFSVS